MNKVLKILITGGDSFLAKSFIRYQSGSFDIYTISRFSTSYQKELVLYDLFEIKEEMFIGFDAVIHCAALVHQKKKQADAQYFKVNYELPVFIAGLAKKAGVKHFIQISTVAVYGKTEHITTESVELPVNAYGKSKLMADNALLSMQEDTFKVAVIRPPMIYGGGDAPGNMMRLIELIAKGYPLPFRNLSNQRDFIHIGNLCHILKLVLLNNFKGILLVSDGNSLTTTELYMQIAAGLNIKKKYYTLPPFLLKIMKKLLPGIFEKLFGTLTIDIEKLKNIFHYDAIFSTREGLKDMCEIVKNRKNYSFTGKF